MNILELVKEAGLDPKKKAACHGDEYSSPCPFCKDGDDRFLIWPNRSNKNGRLQGGRFSCRICGKYGDAITFLRELHGLSYQDACARLRIEPVKRSGVFTKSEEYKPPLAADPSEVWIEKATSFVNWCHAALMRSPSALAKVQERGLTVESIEKYKIGFNPGDSGRDFFRERTEWALPELLKEGGIPRKLWLPVGFTIPTFSGGRVVKVKVRRTAWRDGDKLPKYVELSGSKSSPSVFVETNLVTAGLVLESEFDGLLIQQEAGDLVYSVALGGSTKPLDAETHALLNRTEIILFLPDFDQAGAAAWVKWSKMFPRIKRILTPKEKSAGDYFTADGDLRAWIKKYLE